MGPMMQGVSNPVEVKIGPGFATEEISKADARAIHAAGGAKAVAGTLNLSLTTVYRWTERKEGQLPGDHYETTLRSSAQKLALIMDRGLRSGADVHEALAPLFTLARLFGMEVVSADVLERERAETRREFGELLAKLALDEVRAEKERAKEKALQMSLASESPTGPRAVPVVSGDRAQA